MKIQYYIFDFHGCILIINNINIKKMLTEKAFLLF
jgi:hypothetical protein